MNHLINIWLLLMSCLCLAHGDAANSCVGSDAVTLDSISDLFWSKNAFHQANDPFQFNLCSGSTTDCTIKSKDGTVIADKYDSTTETGFGEIMLTFKKGDTPTVFLYFSCDPNSLGKPVLLDQTNGKYYFEWESRIACRGSVVTTETKMPQIPCYVYRDDDLIDLTDLTNTTSYQVKEGDDELSINICRNVTNCPGAVCKQNTPYAIVTKETKLESTTDGVALKYAKPDGTGCGALINFRCPESISLASGPISVSAKEGCDHTIEWYTMEACPSQQLTSNSTCKLQNTKYIVDFDLSALNQNGKIYTADHGGSEFSYEMTMCGGSIKDCPLAKPKDGKEADVAARGDTLACQKKSTGPGFHRSLGMSAETQLKYVDDTLTMTYSKGDVCTSGVPRKTIINFHCNASIEFGNPYYQGETDCTYIFDWHTRHACNRRQKCVYTDPSNPNNVYDFSSLTVAEDSNSWTVKAGDDKTAYINVCGAVGGIAGCDPSAAVCMKKTGQVTDKDKSVENHGQASTMRFATDDNMISLTYDHGSVCNSQTNHSTTIYFACSNNDEGGSSVGPQLRTESADNTCHHAYTWFTPAACVQSKTDNNNCTITDAGYTYDFNSLSADQNKDGYKFNPCKTLENGCVDGSTFCHGDTVISKTKPELSVTNDHLVVATYKPVDGQSSARVRYVCDHTAEDPVVIKADDSIMVEVNTTLACAPKPVDCRPVDSLGNAYDFSGLKGVNWKANSADGMTYYFSICSTLDKDLSEVKDCPGGAISACQRTSDGHLVNLGYAASNPTVESTGNIHFHYINGKKCGHGNKTPRQTKITLNCATTESEPRMRSEDANCNYEIWWDTPKACPIKSSDSSSTTCSIVKDGIKYDLSTLSATTFNATYAGTTFFVGICSKATLPVKTTGCDDSAVCVKASNGNAYSSGKVEGYSLISNGGNIELQYKNGKDGKMSIITFLCNPDEKHGEIRYLTKEGNIARFQISTSLVCPPMEDANCTRTFGDKTYDFSSLTLHNTNYLSHLYSGEIYYINICHRVIATGEAANCPAGATACMYDPKKKKYTSLGRLTVNSNEFIHSLGSMVYIQYDTGDPCPEEPTKSISTLILMRCVDKNKPVVGAIEVAGGIKECRQNLVLESPAACPVSSTPKEKDEKCGEIDGFNTDSLKKQYKLESESHQYILNFCQKSSSSTGDVTSCNGQTEFGVCQISKNSNHEEVLAGNPQMTAQSSTGYLVFNFTDGTQCQHGPQGSKRNVILTLFCNEYANSDSQPVFVSEDPRDCTYYISWPRRDLCKQDHVPCTVSDGTQVLDLSPLHDSSLYVYADIDDDLDEEYRNNKYKLTICGTTSSPKFKCAGAAVCEATGSKQNIYNSLGYIDGPPTIVGSDKHIELVYPTQTDCKGQTDKKISSVIKFSCGQGKGIPRLVSTDGCTYTFTWETSVACRQDNTVSTSTDCKFKRPSTEEVVDLSVFSTKVYQVDNFAIRICSSLSGTSLGECAPGSAVCLNKKTSTGMLSSMQKYEHSDDVIIQYVGSDQCRGDDASSTNITTMIEFRCKKGAGEGKPEYLADPRRCVNQFIWETTYVCPADCELNHEGHLFDFRHLTSNKRPHTFSGGGYKFTMNLCKDLDKSNSCGNYSNICAESADGTRHAIALTPTLTSAYSPDDKTVVLTYTNPAESDPLTVTVKLICNGKQGSPKFVSKVGNKYTFEWKTYVACIEDDLQEVSLTNGVFTDPYSKTEFSIAPALNNSVEIKDDADEYTYYISLGNPLAPESYPQLNPSCTDGATRVCQYKQSISLRRPIGKEIVKYYYKDEQLQMVIHSDSKCGRIGSKIVTTVINFQCNELSSADSKPTNTDEMFSCRYLFTWDLPQLCKPVSATAAPGDRDSKNKALSPGVTAIIVIIVLACLASATGLIIYKIRKRRRYDGPLGYDRLTTDDDTTGLVSASKGLVPRLYDDDDDDVLII